MRDSEIVGEVTEQECTCGCGAHLVTSEYGPVCTCQCEEAMKGQTTAQEIYALKAQREAIERRLHELTTAA